MSNAQNTNFVADDPINEKVARRVENQFSGTGFQARPAALGQVSQTGRFVNDPCCQAGSGVTLITLDVCNDLA